MVALTLDHLREELASWKGCALAQQAHLVPGEGNPHAAIVFIGEAPGAKEDELRRPFVGAAGKFLDDLLASIGLLREDVYITNVVKYRPPGNRDPSSEEKAACLPWLLRELDLIRPRVIVPLGRHALQSFCPSLSIAQVHGTPCRMPSDGGTPQVFETGRIVFPVYHPAAALHNGSLRKTLFEDFKKLKEFMDKVS